MWQTIGDGGWLHASGAVLPGGEQGVYPVPVDRPGAEIVAVQVLGQPLPSEMWLKALAG